MFISAEFGDYQEDKNAQDYFKDNALFPKVYKVTYNPFFLLHNKPKQSVYLIYQTEKYLLSYNNIQLLTFDEVNVWIYWLLKEKKMIFTLPKVNVIVFKSQ